MAASLTRYARWRSLSCGLRCTSQQRYAAHMAKGIKAKTVWVAAFALAITTSAAAKTHGITLGNWLPVKLFVGPNEANSAEMKVRPLYVGSKIKEFTTGEPHDITDRLFVVRRAYRLSELLPEDAKTSPHWRWQRGGWLVVDRESGRVNNVNLPEFDPYYSVASWYRDYVAYCGVSDSGERVYAIVTQLGLKKPILRRELGAAQGKDQPDSECLAPEWQSQPMRVTFKPAAAQPLTLTVNGNSADVAIRDDDR